MKAKLRRALKGKKEEDRLRMLGEASLTHQSTWWWCFSPILGNFWTNFVICKFWISIHKKTAYKCNATGAALLLGEPIEEMVCIFGFKVMITCTLASFKVFGAELVHQKVKKHPKNDLSATVWTHRSSLGRIKFLGVKWAPNTEIPGVLQSRLKTFPMSYHGLNLDSGKVFKRDLKVALRFSHFFLRVAIFLVFYCNHGFYLMVDNLPM